MAELPALKIKDLSDAARWRYQALVSFPTETITLELRVAGDLIPPIRPSGPDSANQMVRYKEWMALIATEFGRQRGGLLDNYRPVLDQVREWAQGDPIYVYLFEAPRQADRLRVAAAIASDDGPLSMADEPGDHSERA